MTDGTRKKNNKRAFLRRKLVPKWTPEASGNVCRRRSATEGGKNDFLRPAGRPNNEEKLLGGYRVKLEREWRGDDAGTSLAQAPRGSTIIKENRFNNNFKQDLTRRWAAGPANFSALHLCYIGGRNKNSNQMTPTDKLVF